MDAVRISDGEMLMLKSISRTKFPYEVEIATMFSSEPLKSDPKNHCIPIFEVLDVPNNEDKQILVMPLLRAYDSPRFQSVGEAMEFIRQMFEVRLSRIVCITHELIRCNFRRVCSSFMSSMSPIGMRGSA